MQTLCPIDFLDTGVQKFPTRKSKRGGKFYTLSYERFHGPDAIEGRLTTKKRFDTNPFLDTQTAVLEILGVIPGKGTMVKVTVENMYGTQEIVGIAKEEIKK